MGFVPARIPSVTMGKTSRLQLGAAGLITLTIWKQRGANACLCSAPVTTHTVQDPREGTLPHKAKLCRLTLAGHTAG